jgi:hypothetical protein
MTIRRLLALLLLSSLLLPPAAHAQQLPRCAQPASTGEKPIASDCLFILRSAVGLQTCSPECVCAPKGSLPVRATDALLCLKSATGQGVTLDCPCDVCDPSICDAPLATCGQQVDAAESESTAACPAEDGVERTECLARAGKAAAAGDGVCASFETACATCCQTGGEHCDLAPEVPKAVGSFELPSRTILESTPDLPPGPNGVGFMLLDLPNGQMGFDPTLRTPATAAAECAGAVLACFSPEQRNWAGCVTVVPTCPDDRPWESDGPACCVPACLGRYEELRRAGRSNPAALMAAIYETPSCMPGVDEYAQREAVK